MKTIEDKLQAAYELGRIIRPRLPTKWREKD